MSDTTVSKDDSKALRDAYIKGATIDDLAVEYGYTSLEVSEIVVKEVPASDGNGLQADQPEPAQPTKKGK